MSNNHASGTFAPYIPTNLITNDFKKLADAVGLTIQPFNDEGDMVYLFNEDYCTSGYIENEDGTEKEVTDEDLYAAIQDIIRNSEGKLTWVSHEQAYTCDKMRPGEFGGSAVFITADDIQYHGTSSWLERRIYEAETGDIGPDTEDDAPINTLREKALLLACSHFLCDSDELTLLEQYQALEKAETGAIPQGVVVWEPFENFTATDLYNDIEDLRDLILNGMEFAQQTASSANPEREGAEALVPDGICANDYILSDAHTSAWVKVGSISAYIRRTDEGVSVDLLPAGQEDAEAVGSTWATFAECEADDTGLFCGVLPQHDTPSDVQKTLDSIMPEDTVNADDAIESANDLIKAAKVVVERWENAAHADFAQAVANLDVVIGWVEKTLKDYSVCVAPQPDINNELLEACIQARAALPDAWAAVQCDTPKEVVDLLNRAIARAESVDQTGRISASQAETILKGLIEMISEVEDIEHDHFGCQEDKCALCAAKNYIAKIEEGQPSPINLAIVLDGGLVQAVVTDSPEAFKGINTMIIDYDTDGPFVENDSLGIVPQGDGNLKTAYIYATSIENAGIDLARAADFVTDRAYGANQERFAICGHNPCENCKDCNLDGVRCVNEDKCLAWLIFTNYDNEGAA